MHYTRETKVGIFVLAALAVFIFMGFFIGSFRFDRHKYHHYRLYFNDISGLLSKAEVKIAGVKVGWVEDINLVERGNMCAQADVCIDKAYCLYANAYGVVRQEGLLGPAYLEVIPGDPSLCSLATGDEIARSNASLASTDELMRAFKQVTDDMQAISGAIKQALGGDDGVNEVADLVNKFKEAVRQIDGKVLPAITESVDTIAQVVDRDFGRFATRVEQTAQNLDTASEQMLEGFAQVREIAADINEGKGVIGQLMHNDDIYHAVRYTTDNIANAFRKFNELYFTYDGHVENMFERASFSCFKNAKGIFNVRIYPREDYFYLVGVTTSQQGYIRRTTTLQDYTDDCLNEICPDSDLPEWAKYQYIYNRNLQRIKRNAFKVDLQFGKLFKNVAVRAGLIEGTGGFAVDLFLPFGKRHGVISTFKMYDFRGQNRIDDERPHLKWINRIFLFDHIYLAAGFDDFVSRCDKSFFLGAGFRFGDADIRYFVPNFVGT